MESIDDLLSQLKSQYDAPPPASADPPVQPANSLDGLLAQLQNEYSERSQPTSSIPPLPSPTPLPPLPSPTSSLAVPDNPLLDQLKAEYTQKDREEAEARQQQEAAERRQQEHLRQLQRDALRQNAQAWLKKLDRLSSEGLWFVDFAKDYSSEVDAAIDYLAALQELCILDCRRNDVRN
jgi:hypothetical protein